MIRSFPPLLSPPWPRSIAHKRLASMDSGYNQRHDFLSFNHFPEPVGEGEMEEEIVCNRWRDLAGEQIFGQLVRPKDCSPSRLSEEMSVVWASHSAQGHFFPSNDQPPTTFSFFLLAVRSLLARGVTQRLWGRACDRPTASILTTGSSRHNSFPIPFFFSFRKKKKKRLWEDIMSLVKHS